MPVFGDLSRVRTNIIALNALTSLNRVNRDLGAHQLRIATGKRIARTEDDPAGFVIAKTLEARTRGLSVALVNVGDAKSVLQIAEGGLQNIVDVLIRMRERITQSANDTLGSKERNAIENQLDDLANEIDQIVSETQFNNNALIDGTYTGKSFQIGADSRDTLSFGISQDTGASALGVADADLDVSSATTASSALTSVSSAINTVTSVIRQIGSLQQRLAMQENNLAEAITNTGAARSRIEDADMAKEQLEATRLQILQRTAVASLAQANVAPQQVLALFGR